MVQHRVLQAGKRGLLFRVTQPAKNFLLHEGMDMKYGTRRLKRAIERHVVYPLASLLATGQVSEGDVISMQWNGTGNKLTFLKEEEERVLPMKRACIPTIATTIRRHLSEEGCHSELLCSLLARARSKKH